MKLSIREIKFIDDYLIKNEVKFWGVRLELLDHIILSIEEKMIRGLSFKKALLEAHESFGNKLSVYRNETFEKRLYASNLGFKKFVKTKQKLIGKRLRKQYWDTFWFYIISINFLLEYCALISIVLLSFSFSYKLGLGIAMVFSYSPEIFKLVYSVNKAVRKSLNMQLTMVTGVLWFSLSYFVLETFNTYFKGVSPKTYEVLIIFYCFVFPFLRHSLNIYKSTLKIYKEQYRLMFL